MDSDNHFPIRPAPDPLADDATLLLAGSLADAWPEATAPAGLGQRLARRAAQSAWAIGAMVNVPHRQRATEAPAPGLTVQTLYRCEATAALRPGEPFSVRVAEMAPGAAWVLAGEQGAPARDWLVVHGAATLQIEGSRPVALTSLDYHAAADGRSPARVVAGPQGACVLLRESDGMGFEATTSRDAPEAWMAFAPLIQRRVLWRDGPLAAMLYLAEPGASVPQHRHGHDEECLMLRGDLFQDDLLLREGDYQLAPCGTAHHAVVTDTGALIYAHGDLDMDFSPT